MDILSIIKITVIVFVIVFLQIKWAKYRINQWALRNNYTISQCDVCLFNIGPFSYFGTSGGQYIFRLTAMNPEGKIRTGYARAGGFFFGLLRERVEVKWDKCILDL